MFVAKGMDANGALAVIERTAGAPVLITAGYGIAAAYFNILAKANAEKRDGLPEIMLAVDLSNKASVVLEILSFGFGTKAIESFQKRTTNESGQIIRNKGNKASERLETIRNCRRLVETN